MSKTGWRYPARGEFPEKGQRVLAYSKVESWQDYERWTIGEFKHDCQGRPCFRCGYKLPIAWMPLPEPPEEIAQ